MRQLFCKKMFFLFWYLFSCDIFWNSELDVGMIVLSDTTEQNKRTLFVKNIAWATDEDGLKSVFSGCKNVRMPKKPDGSSRG